MVMRKMFSWGRLSAFEHELLDLPQPPFKQPLVKAHQKSLAYGMGRSYGDICLNPGGILWNMRTRDHFYHFDEQTGILSCEAGVLLKDIQQLMIPRGWMLAVTPGTQWVTVGGAIANDIHGKNHHRYGSFGNHVLALDLLRTDGSRIQCSPQEQSDWFAATIGGMGLTGIITSARLQLRPVPGPWLNSETIVYSTLKEFFDLADESENSWEYTVSWVDCFSKQKGRGIFMRANHYEHNQVTPHLRKTLKIPYTLPFSLVNRASLPLCNTLYYYLKSQNAGKKVFHYESFLYPLDHIPEWNRFYGSKGFFQYQCVLPRSTGIAAIQTMLNAIASSGEGSFLNVLKTFGNRENLGMMSFPQPGVTLALDFPNRGTSTLKLFTRLDSIVREAKGRLYMAKDARMPRDLFCSGYPRLTEFLHYRDPGISSALSRRLIEDESL